MKDVTVDWGYGTVQSLGAITGTSTQSHVYNQARPSYIIKATLTDAFGNQVVVTSSVTVITAAPPTILITPTVPTTHSGTETVSFQIQVTVPAGVNVTDVTIDFGDGTGSDLGSVNGTITVTHQYSVPPGGATQNITVTVLDTLGRTSTGKTSIVLP